MDPRERATSCWYRVAGLVSREQKDLAVEIIEAEIRSAQHEVWLEASRLVLTGEPIEVARHLRQSGRYGPRARARSCHSGPRRKLESTIITNTSQMTNIPRVRMPTSSCSCLPRLIAPARVQHHAQHAVDAEPGVPRRPWWFTPITFPSARRREMVYLVRHSSRRSKKSWRPRCFSMDCRGNICQCRRRSCRH
jgi:hypothetical protein